LTLICRWQNKIRTHTRPLLTIEFRSICNRNWYCPTTVIIIIIIKLKVKVTLHRRVTNDFESDILVPINDMIVDYQFGPLINIIVETGVESGLETHHR
jgi:hypothetical protein